MFDTIDPDNPVVALCAKGMAVEGTPDVALSYFTQAWNARRDDYDAAIAAHFLARHQPTIEDTLHWNVVAARHAEQVTDGRAAALLPSLYLNLGDARARIGQTAPAIEALRRAHECLSDLPDDGYRSFIAMGLDRLAQRLGCGPVPSPPHSEERTSMQVRGAVELDIEPLAALWFQGWHDGHGGLFPKEVADHRTLALFNARLRARLSSVRVVGEPGAPMGLCIVNGDELEQLFVAAGARGTGVASALMHDAERAIRDGGAAIAWLKCAIGNDRAARFYEKWGWRRAGIVVSPLQSTIGDIPCEVWRYEKDLRGMPNGSAG
jgi:GNAT superfamily N-acetyltransferase